MSVCGGGWVRWLSAGLITTLLSTASCTELKRWVYEGPARDRWQQPERVIESLSLAPGSPVADLGAGSGYFTFRLAEAVGTTGEVLAVDVDEAMNASLRADLRQRGVANVEVVLASASDPRLAPESLALVFSSNTYHHLKDRVAYFARLRPALAPGGRLALIDFVPEGLFQRRHAAKVATMRAEMESAGYVRVASVAFLEPQNFEIFAPVQAVP